MPKLPTDSNEFRRFHLALTRHDPKHAPHYLKVAAGNTVKRNDGGQPVHKKTGEPVAVDDPNRKNLGKKATETGHKKITSDQAIRRLDSGYNVGIEAETGDNWVLIDVDDIETVKLSEMKPTLTTRSRKRVGFHCFYIADDPTDKRLKNLQIDGIGEIRSGNQYVLAPGSWVDTFDIPGIVPADEEENAGRYTLEKDAPIAHITFDELPKAFKDAIEARDAPNAEGERIAAERATRRAERAAAQPATGKGEGSGFFKLQLFDIFPGLPRDPKKRFPNPFNAASTGESWGVSDKGYLQCYGSGVSHTALSALAVLAGVADYESAGQGFKSSIIGMSTVEYKDIPTYWKMWSHAMRTGMLAADDPIRWDVLQWYALDQGVCTEADLIEGYKLPPGAAKRTKNIIKSKEGIEIINIGTKKPKPAASAPPSNPNVDDELDDYFINKTFIPMVLGNRIMSRGDYKTMKDTGEIFRYADGVYIGEAEADIGAAAQVALDYKSSTHRVNEVIGYIRRATYVNREDFDTDKNIINLENGLFDFETMELKPHTPKYLSLHKSPIFYDPAATCPRTDQFFAEVLQSKDIILMYELFGYALCKDKRMSEAIVFEGKEGDNGKSTMIDLFNAFVGEQATSGVTPNEMEGDKYAVASMFGALLNTVDDLGNTPLSKLGVFKSVVACKAIWGQHKFERRFRFKPDALCVFACNDVPISTDTSDAFFKRMIIVPFDRTFKGDDKDQHLIDKLTTKEAISGLFNTAIAAAKGAIGAGTFTGAGTVDDKKRQYMYASNSIAHYIGEYCNTDDPNAMIGRDSLFERYGKWAREQKLVVKPKVALTAYLEKEFSIMETRPRDGEGSRYYAYKGVSMKRFF